MSTRYPVPGTRWGRSGLCLLTPEQEFVSSAFREPSSEWGMVHV